MRYVLYVINLLIFMLAGCAVTQPQSVPHSILHLSDKDTSRDYFVYLPSSYGTRPLPLVVTCHGTNPWDSAEMQINEWKYLAEKNDFVVIAPALISSRGFLPPGQQEGRKLLEQDERVILNLVNRFLQKGTIDRRAILITGWSAGGFAAYFVGLRRPDLFRVIVARQANYIREYYRPDFWRFNPYQPILIFYGEGDLPILRADSKVAYNELKKAGQEYVFLKGVTGGHFRHPEIAYEFFKQAIRVYPRPFIISAEIISGGGCIIRFDSGLIGGVDDDSVLWDFGDGCKGKGREIVHRYKKAGNYRLVIYNMMKGRAIKFVGRVEIRGDKFALVPNE